MQTKQIIIIYGRFVHAKGIFPLTIPRLPLHVPQSPNWKNYYSRFMRKMHSIPAEISILLCHLCRANDDDNDDEYATVSEITVCLFRPVRLMQGEEVAGSNGRGMHQMCLPRSKGAADCERLHLRVAAAQLNYC